GHNQPVQCVQFSHGGTLIVTAGGADNTAHIWNAATSQSIETLRGHSSWVISAAFNKADTLVVTTSQDGTARVWDVKTGENIAQFNESPEDFRQGVPFWALFGSDEKSILTWTDGARYGRRYDCEACVGSVDELRRLAKARMQIRPLSTEEQRRFDQLSTE